MDHLGGVAGAPRLGGPGHLGRGAHFGDDGEEVPAGEDGVVYFGGGTARPFEYNNDPEKTRQTFNDKGWITLWDVGHLDDEGYLYLTDRKLYMIVSGGVNIYPQEVENVLILHPAVADVAVFGVPEPEMGEEVKAVVQPARAPFPGRGSRRRSSPSAGNASPTTSARARSISPTRCPGARTASSTRALREGYWASRPPAPPEPRAAVARRRTRQGRGRRRRRRGGRR